jgi:phage-related protein
MTFYAANFSYDGIISSEYGIRITSDLGGDTSANGADVQLYTQQLYRNPQLYLLGVQQTPALTIPCHFSASDQISALEYSTIAKWLFGQTSYKKLRILQSDMQYLYYNAIITSPKQDNVGNLIRGAGCSIICDSPFAWENPRTVSYTYNSNGYSILNNIVINNTSDNADYTYPKITFTMNVFGGGLSITNSTDNSNLFQFTGLSAGETITIDNRLQTIDSSLGVNRLPNFNYGWMRYVPKVNNLIVSGNIASLSFTHQFAKKVA